MASAMASYLCFALPLIWDSRSCPGADRWREAGLSSNICCSNVSVASPEDNPLTTERLRHNSSSTLQIKRILLGNIGVLALGAALALGASPAAAKSKHR